MIEQSYILCEFFENSKHAHADGTILEAAFQSSVQLHVFMLDFRFGKYDGKPS